MLPAPYLRPSLACLAPRLVPDLCSPLPPHPPALICSAFPFKQMGHLSSPGFLFTGPSLETAPKPKDNDFSSQAGSEGVNPITPPAEEPWVWGAALGWGETIRLKRSLASPSDTPSPAHATDLAVKQLSWCLWKKRQPSVGSCLTLEAGPAICPRSRGLLTASAVPRTSGCGWDPEGAGRAS